MLKEITIVIIKLNINKLITDNIIMKNLKLFPKNSHLNFRGSTESNHNISKLDLGHIYTLGWTTWTSGEHVI